MVNIEDIGGIETIEEDTGKFRLENIFSKQQELIDKYHPIEMRSGIRLTEECPINLHTAIGQAVIKDYAWRFTEEIGEALEAYNLHPENPSHCQEELSDALHFLTELTIHAGYGPCFFFDNNPVGNPHRLECMFWRALTNLREDETVPPLLKLTIRKSPTYDNLLLTSGLTLEAMAQTCNCLKNKPWKQTQMTTDVKKFEGFLIKTLHFFIALCIMLDMDAEDLYTYYMRKIKVNGWRIGSNY